MSAPVAHVLRGGVEELVPARDLVPGDVVMLADGSMVPADLRLLDTASLRVQEASLTGESVPAEKDAQARVAPGAPLGDRATMAFATAIVTGGRGVGVVVATGMGTEVGQHRGAAGRRRGAGHPLEAQAGGVRQGAHRGGRGRGAGRGSASGCSTGGSSSRLLLLAISLAISVIPESLPATATIVMALGVQRMARHQALVRRLPAVETLGRRHRRLHGQDRHAHREPHERRARRLRPRLGARQGRSAGGGPAEPSCALRRPGLRGRPLQRCQLRGRRRRKQSQRRRGCGRRRGCRGRHKRAEQEVRREARRRLARPETRRHPARLQAPPPPRRPSSATRPRARSS